MRLFALALLTWLGACGIISDAKDDLSAIRDAVNQIEEQQNFLNDHPAAKSASGGWTYDEGSGVLELDISSSEFGCGAASDQSLSFTVVSLTSAEMQTQGGGDPSAQGPAQTWTRVGSGSGIEGSWESTDGNASYLLTLSGDGSFVLSVDGLDEASCGDDGESNTDYFTADGCYVTALPQGAIVADGAFDDWAGIAPIDDPDDDSDAAATGDEISGFYIAENGANIGLRINFAEDISLGVQPSGQYNLGYETENKLGSFQIRYEAGAAAYRVFGDDGQATISAVANDIEITIPWAAIGGKSQIMRFRVDAESDSPGADPIDEGPCFSEANPPSQ